MTHLLLTSPAFVHNTGIPARFTCDGRNLSPPLAWSGIPADAKGLALIVDDPDAPDPAAPKMTWVHWVLYNLPVTAGGLRDGIQRHDLPPGTLEGQNDWQRPGYGGPCPPSGTHRYFFKLYALDAPLTLGSNATARDVQAAMKGHVLAEAQLMGRYRR